MLEQFGNYPEIKWMAKTAARFFSGGDKFQVNPDLENFKLVRFKELRKYPKINEERHFKLMLIGSSNTDIFIDGPDHQIEEILKRLPNYIGKSWLEINNMRLERDFLNCSKAFTSVCNPLVSRNAELNPIRPGEEIPELDFYKLDEVCSNCKFFDPN